VSLPVRITTLLIAFVAVVGGGVFVVIHYLLGGPSTVDFIPSASGGQVNITVQTDAQTTVSDKPTWVTYFIQDPKTGTWEHTSLFKVPANTRINMKIEGFDGATPLRNPFFGQVTGTIGGVAYLDGKATSTLNGWAGDTQHTFQIASLGINVPIASETASKLCSTSPCPASQPHTTTTFSFMTPAHGGVFRWQCIVPCGLGWLFGNGGPMSTFGYMTGEMQVGA
jgi:hypothetical protein